MIGTVSWQRVKLTDARPYNRPSKAIDRYVRTNLRLEVMEHTIFQLPVAYAKGLVESRYALMSRKFSVTLEYVFYTAPQCQTLVVKHNHAQRLRRHEPSSRGCEIGQR